MKNQGLGRKFVLTLGSFLVVGSILVIYLKAPLLPVLLGGLLALALILKRPHSS